MPVLHEVLTKTLWLTLAIAGRYLVVSTLVHAWVWRRGGGATRLNRDMPDRRLIGHEIGLSLASSVIYALPAAVALDAWKHGGTRMYVDAGLYGWAWLPLSFVFYLLVQDGFYYWVHRLMHRPSLFRLFHAGHHRSRQPSAFAAFAFDPMEAAITAWLLPALTFVVPIHMAMVVAVLSFMSLTAVFNHCGWEVLPRAWVRGRAGEWLISATHHSGHHLRYTTNYGLYLRLWDRWMGTDALPAEAAATAPLGASSRPGFALSSVAAREIAHADPDPPRRR